MNKEQFHRDARKLLRKINKDMNLDADIRTNKGGPAVLGETILHADNVYVMTVDTNRVLVRACRSKHDYVGLTNTYCNYDEESIKAQIRRVS